jgi:hypothetical protein
VQIKVARAMEMLMESLRGEVGQRLGNATARTQVNDDTSISSDCIDLLFDRFLSSDERWNPPTKFLS